MKGAAPSLEKMNRGHFREVVVIDGIIRSCRKPCELSLGQVIDSKGSDRPQRQSSDAVVALLEGCRFLLGLGPGEEVLRSH